MRIHHLHLRRPTRDLHRCHQIVYETVGGRALWAQPRLDMLVVQADAIDPPARDVRTSATHQMPDPAAGDSVRFSLIGCPTRMDNRTRKRHQVAPEYREAWLRRKLDGALSVDSLTIDHLGPRVGRKRGHTITHVWTMFTGTGTVTDAASLEGLRTTGIGPGKAHGAGLLVVAPC